jgi:hypothetical protein
MGEEARSTLADAAARVRGSGRASARATTGTSIDVGALHGGSSEELKPTVRDEDNMLQRGRSGCLLLLPDPSPSLLPNLQVVCMFCGCCRLTCVPQHVLQALTA